MKFLIHYRPENLWRVAGRRAGVALLLLACASGLLFLGGCRQAASTPRAESRESALSDAKKVTVETSVPTWLGNYARSFYGTGPWPAAPLEVVWSFKTRMTSGRLHKDPWGGTSWP